MMNATGKVLKVRVYRVATQPLIDIQVPDDATKIEIGWRDTNKKVIRKVLYDAIFFTPADGILTLDLLSDTSAAYGYGSSGTT